MQMNEEVTCQQCGYLTAKTDNSHEHIALPQSMRLSGEKMQGIGGIAICHVGACELEKEQQAARIEKREPHLAYLHVIQTPRVCSRFVKHEGGVTPQMHLAKEGSEVTRAEMREYGEKMRQEDRQWHSEQQKLRDEASAAQRLKERDEEREHTKKMLKDNERRKFWNAMILEAFKVVIAAVVGGLAGYAAPKIDKWIGQPKDQTQEVQKADK